MNASSAHGHGSSHVDRWKHDLGSWSDVPQSTQQQRVTQPQHSNKSSNATPSTPTPTLPSVTPSLRTLTGMLPYDEDNMVDADIGPPVSHTEVEQNGKGYQPALRSTHDPSPHTSSSSSSSSVGNLASTQQGRWVTVFGFPLTRRIDVLLYLSQCGTIQKVVPPSSSAVPSHGKGVTVPGTTHVHIKFRTPLEANQALYATGLLDSTLLVGVVPCKEVEYAERCHDTILFQECGSICPPRGIRRTVSCPLRRRWYRVAGTILWEVLYAVWFLLILGGVRWARKCVAPKKPHIE